MTAPTNQHIEQRRDPATNRAQNAGVATEPSGHRIAEYHAGEPVRDRPRRHGRIIAALPSLLWLLAATVALLDWSFPPDLSRLASMGTEIVDRHDRPLALLPAPGGVWRFHADGAHVSPALVDLLIAVEDRRFRYHPGVDPVALARAAIQFARAGHVVSGGSTLAMQAARLLEPRPRTLPSKLIEMARAIQLETRFRRSGILDIWLTLAPFGGNLEGVCAGSLAWFGVPPEALEPAQAALLVAIPRRPERLRPDRHAAAARSLRDRVLAVGVRDGLFDAYQSSVPVPTERVPLPRHAPQLAASLPHAPLVRTTLDLPLQIALERLGQERLESLPPRASLAMLIADAHSREIRAVFPGAWRDQARSGALDLTMAERSPGSALKPFIYAMAFADGTAAPDTVVPDLPRRFGGYAPENFDRGFAGSITAADALRRSLNLPAVALLDRVGPLRFAATLHSAGVTLRLPHGADPSLPLALGGVGITLRQAAGLYAALATDGAGGQLRLLADEPDNRPDFLPTVAAHLVAGVLTRPLPAFGPQGIAWKTGTSWGGRDAWAFGFDSRHVVAVWIGRPDGTPFPGATGTSLALPQLARVFDLLPKAPRTIQPLQAQHTRPADLAADTLRLLFPPPGAVLSADGPVTIRVMGGRRPLTFLIDGAPLSTDRIRRDVAWLPVGPGFYHLTVLDADGAAVRTAVQVRISP
jgi:penicillin-binding protein 1C